MSKPKLHILITSTRPTRVGPMFASWLKEAADRFDGFEVEVVDLADFNLPVFDEPNHPLMQQYEHEHTKKWSAKVSEADAFMFVLPEYDYFTPASLVNAIQYLSKEWNYKPVGFLSYSIGVSAALRSVQTTKQLVTSVKMMPMSEAIAVPFLKNLVNEKGEFVAGEINEKAAQANLAELLKWTVALKTMRAPQPA